MKSRKKSKPNWNLPSIWRDILISLLYTVIITSVWIIVYVKFGDKKKLDTTIIYFFGAILAIIGLMAKQYLLKETLEYLTTWNRMELLIEKILSHPLASESSFKQQRIELSQQQELAKKYAIYVKREVKIVSVIPVLLVVLYGIALLSMNCMSIRTTCLCVMLGLLIYLSRASITSNELAFEFPKLKITLRELEALLKELNEVHCQTSK